MELTILGFGEEWKGFNWRFNLMRTFLKSLHPNNIVCFVDGYDVFCSRNLNELKDTFINLKKKYNCKVIVGYDNIQSKIQKFFNRINFNGEINAGTYIGESIDILNILNSISDIDNASDDQIILNKYYNKNKQHIHIDKDSEIFGTIYDGNRLKDVSKYYVIKNNEIYTSVTNKRPFFIHGPGMSDLSIILRKINYNCDDAIVKQLKKDISQYDYRNLKLKIIKLRNNKHFRTIYKLLIIIIFILLFYHIYNFCKYKVI